MLETNMGYMPEHPTEKLGDRPGDDLRREVALAAIAARFEALERFCGKWATVSVNTYADDDDEREPAGEYRVRLKGESDVVSDTEEHYGATLSSLLDTLILGKLEDSSRRDARS